MEFDFTEEEKAIAAEVRAFIEEHSTPELVHECRHLEGIYGGKLAREFFGKFAKKGWLVSHWPVEYGGLGSSEMIMCLIRDIVSAAGLTCYFSGAFMAGPTIIRYGSEEMKQRYLLPLARAEVEFALGYTEPGAGSDLLGIKTYAEDKGDHFVVNGQKIFNTACHIAEYHWLAVKTDLNVPSHKGISMMVVDLSTPGITVTPIISMAGTRTNVVYYDDVVVPKENLVGEKNKGFYYLMTALDFERMFPFGAYRLLFEEMVAYAKETVVDGAPLSKDPMVRQKLAQLATELEVANLLYYQLPYMLDKGQVPNYQSSMEKLFVSEMEQRITNVGMDMLGLWGQLTENDKLAPLGGKLSFYFHQSVVETIYGGTSEIQRNIMATRGLGLPRV